MNNLVLLSVIDIVLLIAGLAIYLFIVGVQLTRVAGKLEECSDIVWQIKGHTKVIEPGVQRINSTARVIAGALPLLYGMAEGIVKGATYKPDLAEREPARPAMGTRRSRLHESVGYRPN